MAIQMTKQIVDPSSLINCQKLVNIAVSELEILNGSVNKLDTSIPGCMDSIRSARNKLNTTYNNLINLIYLLGNEANNYNESESYLFNGKSISDIFASGNLAEMNEVLTYLDEVRNKSKDEYNELVKEYENGNLSIDGDLLKCINLQSDSDDDEYNTTYKEFASFLEIEQDDYDKNYSLDKFIISGTSGDAVGITKENGKFILKKQKILRNGKVIWVRTGDSVPDSVYESAKEYFEQRENLEQILKLGNEKLGPLYEKLQNKLDESNNYDELYRQGSYAVKLAPFAQAFKTDEYKNCSISDKDISDFKDDSNIKRNPSLSRGNAKKWDNVFYLLNNSDFEEKKKLLYIYNTMGEDGLLDYVDAMDDSIERQKGINDAIKVLNEVSNSENFGDYAWDTLVVAANGVSDGVGSYLEGIGNTLGGADGKVSALEYKRSYLLQQLSGMASNNMSEIESEYKNGSINEEQYNTLVKLAGISDVRKGVYKHTYNISNSVGNMVIPIGVNVLTGSGIGTALTSASMFGNDLESNLQNDVVGAEAYVSAFGTAAMSLLASKTGMGINPLGSGTISSSILTNAKIYGGEILERNLLNLASGAYKDITYDVFHKDLPWVNSSKPDYLYNSVKSITSNFVSDSIDTLASSFLMQGTKLALQKGSKFVNSKYNSYIDKKNGSDVKVDKPELTYTYNGILRDLKDSYNSGEISYGEYIKYKDAMTLNYTYNMGDIMFNSSKNAVNTNKEALEVYEKSGFKGFFDFLAKNTTKIETDLYNVRNTVKSKPDNVVELDDNSYVVDNSKPNRLQRLEGPLSEENLAVYEADSDLRVQLKSKADELTRRAVKGLTLYKNTLLYNESKFDFGPIIKRAEESINRGDFREIYTACNAALNSRLSNGLTIYDYAKRMGMNAIPLAIQTQNKSMRNSAFFRQYKFYGIRQDVLSYSRITSDVDNVVERYFPHLSEVKKVALLRNAKGMCTYASVAGSIMAAFKKLPYGDIIYEGVFGYPLETKLKDGSVILNESPLLLDLYCFANKNNSTIFSDDNVEIGKYYFCRNAGRDNAVITHFLNQYFPGISVTETISIPKYFEPSEIADLFLKHDYSILGLAPYEDNNIAENIFSKINFYNAAGFKKHTLRSTGHSAIISGFDYDNMELNLSSWGQHIYVKVDEIVKNFRLKKSNPTGQMRIIGLDFDFGPVIKNGVGYFIEHLMNSGNFNTSVLRNLDYSAIQQATSCGLKLGELIQRYVIARAKNHTLTTHDTLDLPLPILTSDIYPGKGFISYINELCPEKPTTSYNPGYELYEKKIILNPIYRPKLISNPSSKSSRLSELFKNGYKVFRNGINYHVARESVLNAQNFIDHGNFNPILKSPKSLLDSKLDNGMTVYEYAVSKGMKEIPEAINIMKRESIIRPFYSKYKYFGVRQDILESSDLTDDLSSIIDGYFPGLSDGDKVPLLKRAEGMCTYASIVQGLMQKYKSMPNGELLYELTFGYPMETVEDGKKVLNEKPIMLDLFCFANGKNRIFDENNEIYTFFSDDKSDTSIVNSFLSKHGASIQMDETFYSIEAIKSAFIYNDVAVLNVYDNTKNRGLIDRNLHRAIYYRMNGSKDVILRNGGHSSNIVGIDLENGRVYVSSWGTEGYVKLSELNAANLNNDENGELFVSTVNFRLTGDVQKKISDYVINGIKNNDLDKIDGQLVIDSKYAPLIAKTLIDSAKAGTLDPDILKKIPQSLLLQKVDGTSLIQSLLENSHGNRSLFIDAMKDKLSASTLADINSYVYGGFGLEDASNNPLAAYIYAKNGNFDFIKTAKSDILGDKVSISGKFKSIFEHYTSFVKKVTTLSTVPKDVRRKIFNRTLTFEEYIKYGLDGIIPISRINLVERPVVEKFGVEKAKTLDWALLNKYTDDGISIRYILMNMDSSTEDINTELYELVKDRISPSFYTPKMKEIYSDRLFSDDEICSSQYGVSRLMRSFNDGELSLQDIVKNWDIFKDKDLSYCLLRNNDDITDSKLKQFMSNYGIVAQLVSNNIGVDASEFIKTVNNLSSEDRRDYIKQFTDSILSDLYDYGKLSNEEYKEIFKYSSLEDYLKLFDERSAEVIVDELKTLPKDYIYDMSIPISSLFNYDVLSFVATYGLENIADFDKDCGHFFSKNNSRNLKLMNDMYIYYGRNLYTKYGDHDEDGNYIEPKYTKDEFYEVMRKIIIYGPTNSNRPAENVDYRDIIGEFREKNEDLFIPEDAPKEFQNLFYTRSITPQILREHPDFIEYLRGKDFRLCFKDIRVAINHSYVDNFYEFVSSKTDFDGFMSFITDYSDVLDAIFIKFSPTISEVKVGFYSDDSMDDIKKIIGDEFKKVLIEKGLTYPKNIPQDLKDSYPSLFLSNDVPQDIKNKFYNREFTINDFESNPDLLEKIGVTNVCCGFSKDMAWVASLFNKSTDQKEANIKRLKIISVYSRIHDEAVQDFFKKLVIKYGDGINLDKIDHEMDVLVRLALTNSSEMYHIRESLATQIFDTSDPLENLNKIESLFLKNSVPTIGKIYSCFEILHPNFQGFNFKTSTISPTLKDSSTIGKKIIVFSDLIKAAFGSNNRSINSYLENIEIGSNLYDDIRTGHIQYDSLTSIEQEELSTFRNYLVTLYDQTLKGKNNIDSFVSTGDTLTDITELSKKLSPDGTLDYSLADRIVKMFCGFAGIDSLEKAKNYVSSKVQSANLRNREAAKSDMTLDRGDFIKGIGGIKYLRNILQNGSVSREYLGDAAESDSTPLDTDLSMILSSEGTIKEKIDKTAANGYGPIWLVLKNDGRFITTRTFEGEVDAKKDTSKLEAFYTGVLGKDHYGIRTGFASSEINYIAMEKYDPRVGLDIVLNGFYIPVVDLDGKVIFTPEDYDKLKSKMQGLSHFGENDYVISNNLVTADTEKIACQIEQSSKEVQIKREKISAIMRKSLEECGLKLRTAIGNDLVEGTAELIDTGSTGRGTNKPGDGDFDFIMRLDRSIIANPSKLQMLKQAIVKNLGKENLNGEITGSGDFRLKCVQIDDETNVDIDITFIVKTDKVSYSTDMAIQDRLATIQKNEPEKYKYVVSNILLAKQVLKQANVYKPYRSDMTQGGLGGIGIENWILQNGGSFVDAARGFVEASEGKSFAEFKESYQVWDFGENHLAEGRGSYPHDNFVDNMDANGYKKMVEALKEYLRTLETE